MVSIRRHRGFSILMALGIIAVLMIMVTGVAVMYMREFKLSRLSYDEIISNASAEGAFEYAMLKIKNHADGFQDSMTGGTAADSDVDGSMFTLVTPRSEGMNIHYEIQANTGSYTTTLSGGTHLILPLYIDNGNLIDPTSATKKSKTYEFKSQFIKNTSGLEISGIDSEVSWTISAYDENSKQNIGLQGIGIIGAGTEGSLQLKRFKCTYVSGLSPTTFESNIACQDTPGSEGDAYRLITNASDKEELMYMYKVDKVKVSDFISGAEREFAIDAVSGKSTDKMKLTNPYLIMYNTGNTTQSPKITADKPFSLPQYSVTATATKGDASQVFRFNEDKSKYYDYLKYGYYGTN